MVWGGEGEEVLDRGRDGKPKDYFIHLFNLSQTEEIDSNDSDM